MDNSQSLLLLQLVELGQNDGTKVRRQTSDLMVGQLFCATTQKHPIEMNVRRFVHLLKPKKYKW